MKKYLGRHFFVLLCCFTFWSLLPREAGFFKKRRKRERKKEQKNEKIIMNIYFFFRVYRDDPTIFSWELGKKTKSFPPFFFHSFFSFFSSPFLSFPFFLFSPSFLVSLVFLYCPFSSSLKLPVFILFFFQEMNQEIFLYHGLNQQVH